MFRDWSGFKCGNLVVRFPIGNIRDGSTIRKVWLSTNTRTHENRIIRSNEIIRQCKALKRRVADDGTKYVIRRIRIADGHIDYLIEYFEYGYFHKQRESAIQFRINRANSIVATLSTNWPGYEFAISGNG